MLTRYLGLLAEAGGGHSPGKSGAATLAANADSANSLA